MARQRFAPQHTIVGEGLFVPGSDSAWDIERVKREIADLRKGTKYDKRVLITPADFDDPSFEHVFTRYYRGVTRFDLDAEGIRGYLDESKRPETFRIKRLHVRTRARALRAKEQGVLYEAYELAFVNGIVGVENGDEKLSQLLDAREKGDTVDGKKVTDDRIVDAAATVAYEIIEEVGAAVLSLSNDLTEAEKKA